jgi:hypothetical protein
VNRRNPARPYLSSKTGKKGKNKTKGNTFKTFQQSV